MKKLISKFTASFAMLGVILAVLITSQGCKKDTLAAPRVFIPGCNDPLAENFNPAATTSDGSCVYSRDKFIGNYAVSSVEWNPEYDGDLNGLQTIMITPYQEYAHVVRITFTGTSISHFGEGYVQGNQLRVTGNSNSVEGSIVMDLTLREGILSGQFVISYADGKGQDVGFFVAIKL